MKRVFAYAALASLAVSSASAADDSGIYLEAGLGAIRAGKNAVLSLPAVPVMTGRSDNQDLSWEASVGYRFNRNVGLELGYVDLGEISSDVADASDSSDARASSRFSADGLTVALVATFPIRQWEPYLKAGALFSNTVLAYSGTVSGNSFGAHVTANNKDALYGLGLRYAFNDQLKLYVDSTYFVEVGEPRTGRADILNTSIGLLLQF
jgi:OOP family OmpA-OmpF porin